MCLSSINPAQWSSGEVFERKVESCEFDSRMQIVDGHY